MKKQNLSTTAKSKRRMLLACTLMLLPTMAGAQCPDNNHPHMIDLGLPSGTKWACCNVGASKPENYGGYYAWGETEEKEYYGSDNYLGGQDESYFIGYDIAGTEYDVAHVKWGAPWVMPNQEQMDELTIYCNSEWTTENGVNGRRFAGPNGASVFLPAAGIYFYNSLSDAGSESHYWQSFDYSSPDSHYRSLWFSSEYLGVSSLSRYYGESVRPVVAGSSTSSNIDFADAAVKAICVANWDTDGDGELSYEEAAAVKDLGWDFQTNDITSFDELQYFTGITKIGYYCFAWTNLKSIIIPRSVTSIELGAFWGCNELESLIVDEGNPVFDSRNNCNAIIMTSSNKLIVGCKNTIIPNTVEVIGSEAFEQISSLTSIDIPNSVKTIEYSAFFGTGISTITIPKSVTNIGSSVFSDCYDLSTIIVESGNTEYDSRNNCNAIISKADNVLIAGCKNTIIPNTVTSIADYAFQYCKFTSITIPYSVKAISKSAFRGCNMLESIIVERGNTKYDSRDDCNAIIETETNTLIVGCMNTVIPTSIMSIGENAFFYCSDLKSINIPNSVTYIGLCAFYGTGLTSLTIPNSVTTIDEWAFGWCPDLVTVNIGNSVTTIVDLAFYNCQALTSVTIPNSVTSIGRDVFGSCNSLTSVTSYIEEPFEIDESVFSYNDATLYVPAGCKEKYEATPAWNMFQNIVEMDELKPVDEGETIDISTDIDANTNLDGNVVGDVYYSISAGDGSYNAAEGCIVVTKPTDDSFIDGQDIFGEDFNDHYTGIVIKVAAGKGSIKIEAETQGNMVLKVKIGDNDPIEMELDGRLKVSFPYNVSEDTYVYIYGGTGGAGAKGMHKAAGADALKIYGIEVVGGEDGIEYNNRETITNNRYYNLNGQRVNEPTKGVFIRNGKKVLVK